LTVPPSLPPKTNRRALAARLIELRTAAGIRSGNALAKRMGVVQSRIWKIEHAELLPGEDDIKAWAQATGAEDEVPALLEMLAEARAEHAFASVFRSKDGPAAYQERVRAIEERSRRIGEFEVAVVPGLLQTADYAREVAQLPGGLRAWGADAAGIEAQVAGKLRRQEILHDPGRQIQMILGEAALRTRLVPPAVLAAQLGKLLSVLRLPAVELGVIGFDRQVPAYTLGGFRVHDDDLIIVESIGGEKYITAEDSADEVAAFLEAFEALRQAASTGAEAEAIIQRALDDLRD
jgi:transcriptional regulator with XRE-family HTH domain